MLAFLPMMDVQLPANIALVSNYLVDLFRVDMYHFNDGKSLMDIIVYGIFELPYTQRIAPAPVNSALLGLKTHNVFINSSGLIFLALLLIPVLGSLVLLSFFKECNVRVKKMFKKIIRRIHQNFMIRYMIQSYFVFLICFGFQFKEIKFENLSQYFQSIFCIVFGLSFICFPIFIWSFYSYHWDDLVSDKQFR